MEEYCNVHVYRHPCPIGRLPSDLLCMASEFISTPCKCQLKRSYEGIMVTRLAIDESYSQVINVKTDVITFDSIGEDQCEDLHIS